MRVICGDYVISIDCAMREGKRLVFKDYQGNYYRTDDYYGDNIALCQLSDLAKNGYIRVNELYIQEDFKRQSV